MIILIVEDAPEVVDLWKRMLAAVGREFRVARSIELAMVAMHERPYPDLVLLDLRLEDSSPVQTIEKIRLFKEANPEVVVMIITGNADATLRPLAEAAGADGFEAKLSMASQERLLTAVKAAFQRGAPAPEKTYVRRVELLERLTSLVTPV